MNGRFPFVKQSKYPHMRPEDIGVWEKLIEKRPDFYDSVDYDYRVGRGRNYPNVAEEWLRRDFYLLTQLRIDAVGYRGDEVHIIEVKPVVNVTALGQVIAYTLLYSEANPDAINIVPVIVAGDAMPDVQHAAEQMGVQIFLV